MDKRQNSEAITAHEQNTFTGNSPFHFSAKRGRRSTGTAHLPESYMRSLWVDQAKHLLCFTEYLGHAVEWENFMGAAIEPGNKEGKRLDATRSSGCIRAKSKRSNVMVYP